MTPTRSFVPWGWWSCFPKSDPAATTGPQVVAITASDLDELVEFLQLALEAARHEAAAFARERSAS